MKMNNLLAATAVGLIFTSFSYGQTTPQPLPDHPKESVEVQKDEKMRTLFSGTKRPLGKINYLGLSLSPELQYGTLAGQFTPMRGMSGMLHINKKWGIGMGAYSTVNNQFTPTALSASKALNLRSMYGGLKFEYTPKPNAKIHVSFPLLIGAGVAQVDSVGSRGNRNNNYGWGRNEGRGRGDNRLGRDAATFFVIQPGINLEVNVFRFAKAFAGVSYRIVPTIDASDVVSTLPTPTASQISGFNLSAGVRLGLFDYQLHRAKGPRKQKRTTIR